MQEKIDGPFVLEKDIRVNDMITGNTTVRPGATLDLYGLVGGDLIAAVGGAANVYGTVAGVVHNRGGKVNVYGSVADVIDQGEVKTMINSKAMVRKR